MSKLTYEQRLAKCTNPLMKKLLKIIISKKTNLCVAANFTTLDELLRFVDKVGQHICILKIQYERMVLNQSKPSEHLELLYERKRRFNFLLFEDRKFVDTGETVEAVYKQHVQFVDLVTLMPRHGDGIFQAIQATIKEAQLPEEEPRGCLAVCQTSYSKIPENEVVEAYETSRKYPDICVGIVAQGFALPEKDQFSMIKASPGVHINKKDDGKTNQNWRHPSSVINDGADVVIVGRGIVAVPEEEWESTTALYKEVCWKAYEDACK